MPAPIDGDGSQTKIDGGEVVRGCDAGLAQDRCRQQSAEPGGKLQHLQHIPGVEQDDGAQDRRQTLGFRQDYLPFVEALIFVPVEIIDHNAALARSETAWRQLERLARLRPGKKIRMPVSTATTRQ